MLGEGEEADREVGGAAKNEDNMGKMKQLQLDILESQEAEEAEQTDKYAFPDRPIVPTKIAVFDDADFLNKFMKKSEW